MSITTWKWKTFAKVLILVYLLILVIRISGIGNLLPEVITKTETIEVSAICPVCADYSQEELDRKRSVDNAASIQTIRMKELNHLHSMEQKMLDTCAINLAPANRESEKEEYENCIAKVDEYITNQKTLWLENK